MTNLIEFNAFPKIPRLNRDIVITEKIDGTNAAIGITVDGDIYAQSRKKVITLEEDNFGFAAWVSKNKLELISTLGPGLHFGEWWGHGIQRGYGLLKGERRFSLFNVKRWKDVGLTEYGLTVVPTLYEGPFHTDAAKDCIQSFKYQGSVAARGFDRPEGIIIYHSAANQMFKVTVEDDHTSKAYLLDGTTVTLANVGSKGGVTIYPKREFKGEVKMSPKSKFKVGDLVVDPFSGHLFWGITKAEYVNESDQWYYSNENWRINEDDLTLYVQPEITSCGCSGSYVKKSLTSKPKFNLGDRVLLDEHCEILVITGILGSSSVASDWSYDVCTTTGMPVTRVSASRLDLYIPPTPEPKFKVGDRVRNDMFIGTVTSIETYDDQVDEFWVAWDKGGQSQCDSRTLTLYISPTPAELIPILKEHEWVRGEWNNGRSFGPYSTYLNATGALLAGGFLLRWSNHKIESDVRSIERCDPPEVK